MVPLENTPAIILLAVVLCATVYGTNSAQVFLYYMKHSAKDNVALKLLVATLWILDTACLILTCSSLVSLNENKVKVSLADLRTPWSLGPAGIIVAVVSLCIHSFYAYKIYELRRSVIIPTLILCMSVGIAGLSITFFIKYIQSRYLLEVFHNMRFAKLAAGLHIPCNTLITVSLVIHHVNNWREARSTNSAFTRFTPLAFYSIDCGARNLVFSVASFVFLLKFPNSLIFVPFFLPTLAVYFSSFMANLNSRNNFDLIVDTHGVLTTRRMSMDPNNARTAYKSAGRRNTFGMETGVC
ncbi:hypothetical protein BGW80DRAFT_1373450 [Lactifluus volemus]|nr:hypothetical protein BGW80DRAFT_1373450 [Lactifluus volemus]